jgi:leucyl-tRNA synthetase
LNRVYRLVTQHKLSETNDGQLDKTYHEVVKKVTQMIEDLKFNTALSQLMVLVNAMYKQSAPLYKGYVEGLVKMLSPFAPYLSEEL